MGNFISSVSVAPNWLWIVFSIGILVLLAIDLSLFGKGHDTVSKKKALIESALWISIALLFNLWFGYEYGKDLGIEFLTGYLVEKSLSVDNLFIILLIFSSFKIPEKYQHRVLFYGVLGAIAMRAFFIILGAQLLNLFHWILYVFGAILVITAIKFIRESDEKIDAKESWSIRLLKKFFPTTDKIEGQNFFVLENGVKKVTPLFLALVVIEVTDLVFAVDSIPAVFAVTQDAFVAFASNILAILGLRALYFVLADWVVKLRYLKPGLAAVLGFIGTKMLIIDFVKIPSWVSLLVITAILATAALSSWYVAKLEEQKGRSKDPFENK
ncbi:TerC family protein [Bdellovibrio reynosensis]|uniref:TerC family protein n=1 Tax=Bdellovibrio reynosensis TaxID=2835041 RepID=A0ABY4CDD1_9BACT|nr:TerC family protein [Bdellovibrio reynosensis]UOF02910.1 TerC family protein [Bdellovibrio reynosensis]